MQHCTGHAAEVLCGEQCSQHGKALSNFLSVCSAGLDLCSRNGRVVFVQSFGHILTRGILRDNEHYRTAPRY